MRKPKRRRAIGFYTKKRNGEKRVVPITCVRRVPVRGRVSKVISLSLQPPPTARETLGAESYATVMEVSRYLAGYLSGRQGVAVRHSRGGEYYCRWVRDVKEIYVPDWRSYELPVKGVSRWRIYRNGLWHETQHIKYSKKGLWEYAQNDQLAREVANIIEDRRVEDLGIAWHRGYKPELIYSHAYGLGMRPNVADLWQKAEKLKKLGDPGKAKQLFSLAKREAFLQKLITGRQKGKLPKHVQAKVDDVVDLTEKSLPVITKKGLSTLDKLTHEVIARLNLRIVGRQTESQPDWETTFTQGFADNQRRQAGQTSGQQQRQIREDMEQFFKKAKKDAEKAGRKSRETSKGKGAGDYFADDVEQAEKGDAQVVAEFQKIKKGALFKRPKDLSTRWQPIADINPTGPYKDARFRRDMQTKLRDWKLGRKMQIAKTGQLVSVYGYVATGGKKPFRRITRQTVKGQKYLFVLDFSGSIGHMAEAYKKALINTMETLDAIKAKIAVFAFGGGPEGRGFYRVKTFEKPKWKLGDSGRLATLSSTGGTPLSTAYRELQIYIKKHKPDATVSVTDGGPDDPAATQEQIKKLKKHTRMVAFGIANPTTMTQMDDMLRELRFHKHFVVDEVSKIPPKLVDMIAPVTI